MWHDEGLLREGGNEERKFSSLRLEHHTSLHFRRVGSRDKMKNESSKDKCHLKTETEMTEDRSADLSAQGQLLHQLIVATVGIKLHL